MGKADDPWDLTPKDVKKAINEPRDHDCLPCKAVGSMALFGLGGYNYYIGMRNLRRREQEILRSGSKYRMGSRQLGIVTISAGLVGMGIYRALN